MGRRKVLLSSAAACSVSMIVISITLAIKTTAVCFTAAYYLIYRLLTSPFKADWIFVAFCFIFFDVFSLGILPISWLYASEIMPTRFRNKGVALGVSSHWASNAVIVYVTPVSSVPLDLIGMTLTSYCSERSKTLATGFTSFGRF